MSVASNFSAHQLIAGERSLPATFANVCEKPYGRIYYNTENPASHDSNHAVILNPGNDLDQALDDLILFYRLRSLVPRIYPSYQPGEKKHLFPILHRRGFQLERLDSRIYMRQNPCQITSRTSLQVKRVKTVNSKIGDIVRDEDGGDWNLIVMERQLQFDNFHLLVGYDQGEPVCLATLAFIKNLTRLDDVITDLGSRARGYGRALIKGMLDYHDLVAPGNQVYLWASNPTAIKIYREAGFVELENGLEPWEAWFKAYKRK